MTACIAAAGTTAAAGQWSKRATVTAAPSTDADSCSSAGAGTCNTLSGAFTATPVGGNGIYTYLWELVSTNASGVAFGTGSAASTTVTVTGTKSGSGAVYTTVVRCRVISPGGADVFSNNVTITSTHTQLLQASVSGAPALGSCGSPGVGSCNAVTNTVTAVPSGGSGSYTYAWQHVSGTAANVGSPGNVTTAFNRTATKAPGGNVVVGSYRVQITDTVTGQVATSANFNVQTTHTDTT